MPSKNYQDFYTLLLKPFPSLPLPLSKYPQKNSFTWLLSISYHHELKDKLSSEHAAIIYSWPQDKHRNSSSSQSERPA